ncbi:MAG: hypothetical protein KBD38_02395 [Bacteroides sp.]|nr:hypothetical protein [Bacteroides sp.]
MRYAFSLFISSIQVLNYFFSQGLSHLAPSHAALGHAAESAAWQHAFAESHTCSVFAAQQESASVALESAAFLLPQDVTAKENATATAANKTLVFILSICFKR